MDIEKKIRQGTRIALGILIVFLSLMIYKCQGQVYVKILPNESGNYINTATLTECNVLWGSTITTPQGLVTSSNLQGFVMGSTYAQALALLNVDEKHIYSSATMDLVTANNDAYAKHYVSFVYDGNILLTSVGSSLQRHVSVVWTDSIKTYNWRNRIKTAVSVCSNLQTYDVYKSQATDISGKKYYVFTFLTLSGDVDSNNKHIPDWVCAYLYTDVIMEADSYQAIDNVTLTDSKWKLVK